MFKVAFEGKKYSIVEVELKGFGKFCLISKVFFEKSSMPVVVLFVSTMRMK